ncbi:HIRAN domain-containing protein [Anaerococcus lactolyticus]|uniref:HIRAN domain-containing protein n=1 Tax=Anaerococcus lactolyticus TaxID=33032 RepID=UPI0023F55AAD|nr:HIRAN domain-containing protein [Anaerococcus lactolyticus]
MTDLVDKGKNNLIDFLVDNGRGIDIPRPFEQDIYLFDTYVAGTTHVEGIDKIYSSLKEDDKLFFYREVENEHDPQAIRIETLSKEKIGYVPRQDNVVFSRLMDAGKVLFAKINEKEMRGKWAKIEIKIYLHES